ncbi:MAG: PDZ domain-containing protein [Bacteroidota bacterium]|nr:PDZ domain-containing protein [Bacteroidota bacterium]
MGRFFSKSRFSISLLLLWVSLSASNGYSQTSLTGLRFVDSDMDKISFNFEFINNLIIIPLLINNSDSLYFILDTGLNISILTELSMGDSLSLNYTKQVKLGGLGGGESIDALHSYGNTFQISGVRGDFQHLYIILQNVFNLSSMLGTRVHGLIGYNLFKDFIVEIDYEKKKLTLHRPETYKMRSRRRSYTLPIILDETKPYIYATIIQKDGTRIRVKLLLDTGASHALWLDVSSDPDLKKPDFVKSSYIGTGLNGEIHGEIGRIYGMEINDFSIKEPIVVFPDSNSAAVAFGIDGRNGSLGNEILRRFNQVIDYTHNQITLTPNKFYKDPFKVNRTGIEIIAPIPGLSYYTISSIRKESPGKNAGLKPGDILESVNRKRVSNLSIEEVYSIFEGEPGDKIKMVVRRNDLRFVTYFYLEQYI